MSAVVISGGSAAVYPVLRALADRPRPADPGGRVSSSAERAVVLAAADPAQPRERDSPLAATICDMYDVAREVGVKLVAPRS